MNRAGQPTMSAVGVTRSKYWPNLSLLVSSASAVPEPSTVLSCILVTFSKAQVWAVTSYRSAIHQG